MIRKPSNRRGTTLTLLALSCLSAACDKKGAGPQPVMTPAAPPSVASGTAPAEPSGPLPGEERQSTAGTPEPGPATIVTTGPVVTLEQFDALKKEVSEKDYDVPYSRFVEAFGWKGVESNREDFGGVVLYDIEWMNPDGGKVLAVFRDDKIYKLEQTGLKTVEEVAAEAVPGEEDSAAGDKNLPPSAAD
jgi:hypothetical protein